MNTSGYGGSRLKKKIVVLTNDPDNREIDLSVSGPVEKFVSLSSNRVILRGKVGTPVVRKVTVTPRSKYPFKIIGVKSEKDTLIRYELAEVDDAEGKKYELTIENLQQTAGQYQETISLATDSSIRPEIVIWVHGLIQKDRKSKAKSDAKSQKG